MSKWPNLVDLVILIFVIRGCYVGYIRGVLTELCSLTAAVLVTVLACNSYGSLAQLLSPWWYGDPLALSFLCFFLLFAIGFLIAHNVLHRIGSLTLREKLHAWVTQAIGALLGIVRGAWWAGLVLLIVLSLGIPYATTSVEERSILAPRLVKAARRRIGQVADRFPGARGRTALVPEVHVQLPRLPFAEEHVSK